MDKLTHTLDKHAVVLTSLTKRIELLERDNKKFKAVIQAFERDIKNIDMKLRQLKRD